MNDLRNFSVPCRICGGQTNLIARNQPCFQAPKTFDVGDCPWCDTRFVACPETNNEVYELIYNNASLVPGYDRYSRYAAALPWAPDPLRYLSQQEDVYWSIKESIDRIVRQEPRRLRILEIGSGFGYLTYALRKANHDCTGIDISAIAVNQANKEFGEYYEACDLMDFVDPSGKGFDVVVATELIEHVTDPGALVARAASLLKPGGSLLLTTPNKDLYSDRVAWHTDLAPVHLWWFSKTSMRRLAWASGLDIQFVDFSPFYGRAAKPFREKTKPQTFDSTGQVIYKDSVVNTLARYLMLKAPGVFKTLGRIFIKKMARERTSDALYRDSLSLCAVMRKPDRTLAAAVREAA
jgi:SAM-dependent methyltransferase